MVNDRHATTSTAWRKSSYSNQAGGDCVEAAGLTGAVGIRDSKDTPRGHLAVPSSAWTSLLNTLKANA